MHVSEQQAAFELAVAKRLDVDPTTATFEGWETNGDAGWINLRHLVPADELWQMWHDAAPPPPLSESLSKRVDELLTSEPALAAFREAWEQADAEGASGDRVRRGMAAAIRAVS